MSPKAVMAHAVTQYQPCEMVNKSRGSDNVCTIYWINRTQTYPSRRAVAEALRVNRSALQARFTKYVNKSGECWLWTGHRSRKGYGMLSIRWNGKTYQTAAHRLAWLLTGQSIPDDLFVCHHCDRPLCVNPNHLFLGTQQANIQDASQKGRLTVPRARRLTLAERVEIYFAPRDRASSARLMRKFGISKVVLCHTRRGRFVGCPTALQRVPHVIRPVVGEVA